jgi:DNA-binding transcriptional ArsR family regulator
MADESFVLLSLREQQSKKLAQVIGNETARLLLDHLSSKEFSTETELAKALKLPLSTVHYNMKALVESGLVLADEYHYSEKGKEVPHYRLAKKLIIIAPKDEKSLAERLRKLFPLAIVAIAGAALIEIGGRILSAGSRNATEFAGPALMKAAAPMADVATDEAARGMMLSAEAAPLSAQASVAFPTPAAVWFFAGACAILVIMLAWELSRKK